MVLLNEMGPGRGEQIGLSVGVKLGKVVEGCFDKGGCAIMLFLSGK